MNKDLEDKVILRNLITALNIKKKDFYVKLRYNSQTTIYNVLSGKNKLSTDMIHRIQTQYPQVSYLYLTRGKGEPIIQGVIIPTERNINIAEEKKSGLEALITMPDQITFIVKAINELKTEIAEIKKLIHTKNINF